MREKMIRVMAPVSVCALLAASAASGQTLSVVYPTASALTPPLSQLPDGPKPVGNAARPHRPVPSHVGAHGTDTAVQTEAGPLINASSGANFDGPGANGYAPSDNNIAVGPNHIFAAVNSVYQIYTKTGSSILGPKSLSTLWSGVGGGCSSANAGDVVVQYDKIADRWLLTQLSSLSSPYGECIAVSTTNDPTGTYKAYYYTFNSNLPDYPKFGVWPTASNSAYLATYNQFANASQFAGAALCAYDRSAMLAAAASPAQICYTISNDGSFLPSDLDGSAPPADGTPGYFLTYETSTLRIWTLAPNFANPASSVLTQVSPDISIAAFSELCGGGTCVPQSGTNNQLDSLADRPMYRLAYRNFGDHEAMVVNHSVTNGVRWYELRSPVSPSGSFSLFQQGTYGPDATTRWMGSAAMDQAGDIAIGYSASSSTIFPAVRYSGRVPGDALGTLESEASIIEGTGSQTNGLTRWGDYSSLRIDPSDDCTFWYINEYLKADGAFNWNTRIGSFKFGSCGTPLTPPGVPGTPQATGTTSTSVSLSWTAPGTGGAPASYAVLRCLAPCNPTVTVGTTTSTTYTDTALSPSTSYTYAVTASNSAGSSGPSGTVTATTLVAAPGPPGGLVATPTGSSTASLSWSAPTTGGAPSSYHVLRCQGGGCNPTVSISTTATTAFSDTGLSPNTTYEYAVTASNAGGTSGASNIAAALTKPGSPASLTVTNTTSSQVSLSWSAPAGGATNYSVLRCSPAPCTPATPAVGTTAATSYTDTTVAASTSYAYAVVANNSSGASTLSNTVTATTPAGPPPPTPTGLTATAVSATQVNVSWNGVAGATYILQRCSGVNCANFSTIATPASPSFADTTVSRNTSYSYRVAATNANGASAYSSGFTVRTPKR